MAPSCPNSSRQALVNIYNVHKVFCLLTALFLQHTITAEAIWVESVSNVAAAGVGTNRVVAVLLTLVSPFYTLINVYFKSITCLKNYRKKIFNDSPEQVRLSELSL